MLQCFTRCTTNAMYTLPFSVPVHRTISPGLFGPVHQIRLAVPFTSTVLRPRFQLCSPSPSPQPFSILVSGTVLHPCLPPPSSSPELFSILVFSPVHRIRLRNRPQSRLPPSFSILVSETVLHPRFQHCSPDSSPELSSILVSVTILHPVSLLRFPSSSPEPSSILVFSRPVFFLTLAMIHPTCLHLCTKLLSKARKGDAIHPEKSALFTIY